MEFILDQIADVMMWGSVALLVWGGALTIGHMFASSDRGTAAPRREQRPPRRAAGHSALTLRAD